MKYLVVLVALVAVSSAQFNSFGKQKAYRAPVQAAARATAFVASAPARTAGFAASAPARAAAFVAPAKPAAPAPKPVAVASRSASSDQVANIVRYESDLNPDGSFSYNYETDNGISGQAQGTPRDFGGNPPAVADVIQGSFAWTSPEGQPISISYVADENGYQPTGDALPTPPPIPPQIARALEYLAKNAPLQK